MALDFIKVQCSRGPVGGVVPARGAGRAGAGLRPVISGVVGAASSVTSVQVANLLRLFKIPQVSYFSTSPELSNKARFEYFTRTIPSDLHQARAIVAIVRTLGWRYVSIIYEESNYGIKAFEELETLLARDEICIAVKERLVKDSGEAPASAYDAIVARLLARPGPAEVAGVMAAVVRAGAEGAFGWVGSDGWSARALVAAAASAPSRGPSPCSRWRARCGASASTSQPHRAEQPPQPLVCRVLGGAVPVPVGGPGRGAHAVQLALAALLGRERLSPANTELEAQLQFVADAVLALVHALRDMHAAECAPPAPAPCPALRRPPARCCCATCATCASRVSPAPPRLRPRPAPARPASPHVALRSGEEFHFDANGDGPARYNIMHFKQVERGVFRWLRVGRYRDGELELDMDAIQFKWGSPRPPESVCSAECDLGQAKQYVEGESCCWHCFNCTQYEEKKNETRSPGVLRISINMARSSLSSCRSFPAQIRAPESETACRECPRGTLPTPRARAASRCPRSTCGPPRPPRAAPWPSPPSASCAHCTAARPAPPRPPRPALTRPAVGRFVLGVWVVRGDTPVVRASGRELSFVLLGGILVCYLLTFLLVLRPTDALCTAQRSVPRAGTLARHYRRRYHSRCAHGPFPPRRFGTGLCFTIVYAALLTKTNRIARIFAAGSRSARRPAFISPRSQLAACGALVGAQLAVLGAWQAAAPARAVRHLPARDQAVLVCDAYVDASHTLAFSYPAALVLTCTVYAVLTRKIPEAFNESKHIGE
ncbi:LOW QUALITY PROTEIN: hypothetical protein MSG28_010014 [Choristoneura fumiferana]|uniref:Uncharacterized protein n=1 Tax=Choristoneura fumiferana TaxID=7141 RepID=A0ACC0KJ91_CHOFU|nr:LOW QUALITY PROTEIN: hypothetical protein MSG28_010014 [Choristoneura fumiferana]